MIPDLNATFHVKLCPILCKTQHISPTIYITFKCLYGLIPDDFAIVIPSTRHNLLWRTASCMHRLTLAETRVAGLFVLKSGRFATYCLINFEVSKCHKGEDVSFQGWWSGSDHEFSALTQPGTEHEGFKGRRRPRYNYGVRYQLRPPSVHHPNW